MSIRLKFVIMSLATALIPALFGGIITFNNYKHSLEHSSLSNIKIIADFTKYKIEKCSSHLEADMVDMSPVYGIIQNLPEMGNTGEQFSKVAHAIQDFWLTIVKLPTRTT